MHIRFYFTIINLLFFSFGYSQKNQLLNVKLYNNEILLPINNWYNNELLSDTKIDNFLYFKIDNKYYKKANTTEIIPQLFGAKANGQYNLSDDTNSLIKGDDDDKIRLNQRKPSKYKGLRRFGPEKNLQRINKFMKERPIFYKNLIQMKENFRFYLRCFYCITKVVILQFNSENRTELARNG